MVDQMRHTTIRTGAFNRIHLARKLVSSIELAALPGQIAAILAGATFGALLALSFGRLIFAGAGPEYAATGTALMLWGSLVTGVIMAVRSRFTGVIAGPQDLPVLLMSSIVTAIVANAPGMKAEAKLGTLMALVIVVTLAMGAALLLVGRLRLGRLAAAVPDFAVGGLLAGTGWMLLQAVAEMVVPGRTAPGDFAGLLAPDVSTQWAPVAGGALLLLFVVRRYPRSLALPAVLMALTVMFVLLQPHHPGTQMSAEADGAPAYALLRALQALPYADWPALARHTGDIVAIVAISVFMVLVHARGIGLSLGHKVDLDDELRQTGTTNLLAGMLGACGGYHYVSDTLLVQMMGGGRRWVAVVVALGAGATMAAGEWLLILFPAALLASLLGFIGLTLLVEWLYDRRRTLTRTQYVMMVAICMALAGWGLAAGLVVAVALSLVNNGWHRTGWAEGGARDAGDGR